MNTGSQNWYIVKENEGICRIVKEGETVGEEIARWGPFGSREEAIARRVGLIRAGKCQPL